jgi:hypothetical protein
VFKRFAIGFALGMAVTNYMITSSLPLLDQLEGWLRGAQGNYTGQKTHKAADQVFDHERR